MRRYGWGLALVAATMPAWSALAQDPPPAASTEAGVPVYPGDITDRPYIVLGEVRAGVRKATLFSNRSSPAKIYRELWERAAKMGADAVINAHYGSPHVTALSWGKTNAAGTAIKFTGPAKPR